MRYANIIYNDTVNVNSGVALTVFSQGCTHHCKDCFSKETWDFNGGKEWTKEDEKSLIYCLKNFKYDWLCLCGGDPLMNIDFCNYFISICKKYQPNIKVWCYTGYELIDVSHLDVLKNIDVLKCGRFEKDKKVIGKLYGSSNQKIYEKINGEWIMCKNI